MNCHSLSIATPQENLISCQLSDGTIRRVVTDDELGKVTGPASNVRRYRYNLSFMESLSNVPPLSKNRFEI